MKIKLGDNNWKIRLLSPEKFFEIHKDNNCGAVTDTGTFIIDFRTDEILMTHVRHELFHAYFTLTLTENSKMAKDDVEELSATIIGKYGEDLIKNSKKIYNWLKKQGV